MGRNRSTKKLNPAPKNQIVKPKNEVNELCDQLLLLSTSAPPQNTPKIIDFYQKISDTVKEIQKFEVNHNDACQDADRKNKETIKNFLNWLSENGANYDGVEISEFPGYDFGLKTKCDIVEDSLVVTIPRKVMMTIDAAKKSNLRELLAKDKILQGMNNVALSMFLLVEKYNENSFWKPYIDALPNTYSTVLYFTYDEILQLRGTPVFEQAINLICSIARQYAYFFKIVHNSDDPASKILRSNFTYENYRWAVSTIMTRQNSIPSEDGPQLVNALIPLWDFCNHTNGTISTQYNPELKQCECMALKNFGKGEQFFISYGNRSNNEFFIHNGFVFEDNVNDGYWLKLGISKSDLLKEKRTSLLNKIEIPTQGEYYIKFSSQPFEIQLVAFLRVFIMTEDQLDHWIKSDEHDKLKETNFETDLDDKIWKFLKTRLQLILASLKNVSETKSDKITQCGRLATKIRDVQIKILDNALKFIGVIEETFKV